MSNKTKMRVRAQANFNNSDPKHIFSVFDTEISHDWCIECHKQRSMCSATKLLKNKLAPNVFDELTRNRKFKGADGETVVVPDSNFVKYFKANHLI